MTDARNVTKCHGNTSIKIYILTIYYVKLRLDFQPNFNV
jgi:hypothetical protein